MKTRWMVVLIGAAALSGVPGASAQGLDATGALAVSMDQQIQDETAARDSALRPQFVSSILAARERASGRPFSGRLKASLATHLLKVPADRLEAFYNAGGLGDIEALARETAGPRVLGDTGADLVFTPVAPCRIVNTTVAGGVIAANTTRNLYVNGTTAGTFENQGGTAGGCGIPDSATSVEMNFIAVAPAAAGDLRAFPFGTVTAPLASVINYANVPGLNIANGLATPVCNPATTTCTFDLVVQADVASSHLVIDVVGYYSKVDKAQVKSSTVNATTGPGTSIPLAATCTNTGGAQVTVVAPVAGKIVAQLDATYSINHVTGTLDIVLGGIGTTATNGCIAGTEGANAIRIEASWPTAAITLLPLSNTKVFTAAAGSTTTLFLNSDINSGTGHDIFQGRLQATFIPD